MNQYTLNENCNCSKFSVGLLCAYRVSNSVEELMEHRETSIYSLVYTTLSYELIWVNIKITRQPFLEISNTEFQQSV
jgi:hypothetical protein